MANISDIRHTQSGGSSPWLILRLTAHSLKLDSINQISTTTPLSRSPNRSIENISARFLDKRSVKTGSLEDNQTNYVSYFRE
jgi:hypothetical protein